MKGRLVPLREFWSEVREATGLGKGKTQEIYNTIEYLLVRHLAQGEDVKVVPGFIFKSELIPERTYKLPDGREMTVPEHLVPKVTVTGEFKEKFKNGDING